MVNNKCSVPYCPVAAAGLEKRGKGRGNVTHFSFPKDPDLRDQWIAALNRDNFTPTTSSRVCEIHFDKDDFIPPKNPHKLHVVKRLKENSIPKRHLGDGGGLEEITTSIVSLPNVELETVVTDGTVQYETIEQDISLRPPDVEQTIQIAEANVETIIVKMEDQGSSTEVKTDETATSVATIKKLQPLKGGKGEEAQRGSGSAATDPWGDAEQDGVAAGGAEEGAAREALLDAATTLLVDAQGRGEGVQAGK